MPAKAVAREDPKARLARRIRIIFLTIHQGSGR